MGKIDEIEAKIEARMSEIDQRVSGVPGGRLDEIMRKVDGRMEEINRRIFGTSGEDGGARAPVPGARAAVDGTPRGMCRRIGLAVGLTATDPAAYGGIPQPCPGCDVDAADFNKVMEGAGFETTLLLNEAANWGNVSGAISDAAGKLVAGDLFVLLIAGHGGQIQSVNPATGRKETHETWCLWDGEVADTILIGCFGLFRPGVRIVVVNDQCHAAGMFRDAGAGVPARGFRGLERDFGANGAAPMLIQFAACRTDQNSAGMEIGGTWTTALLKVLAVTHDIGWREWFDRASVHMSLGKGQTPQWIELGPVTEEFRQGRIFI